MTNPKAPEIVNIPLNLINGNPFQTRLKVNDEDLGSLVSSIRKHGVVTPVVVRRHPKIINKFQLVSGHRRVRACKIAGLFEIPAIIKQLSDAEMAAECLVENMQRKQLSVIEEARGYRELRKLGHTLKEISDIAGKSRPAISNALRLLRLDPFVQLAVLHKTITPWHARMILALPKDVEQYRVVDLVTDWNLTTEELKKIVQDIRDGEELISWRRQVPISGLFCPHARKNDCFDMDLYNSMKMQGQLDLFKCW